MTIPDFLLLLAMTIIGAFGAFFLKKASSFYSFKSLLKNVNVYIGGLLYFSSALINIYLLRRLEYSLVLPLTCITYIWTMIISYLFLKEKISIKKCIGISFIILGVILLII